jgi:hypothetical protein
MLNVPAGSNTGTSLRLKGRGLLDRKSKQRGDQYVKLKVVLPEAPDDKLKGVPRDLGAGQGVRSARRRWSSSHDQPRRTAAPARPPDRVMSSAGSRAACCGRRPGEAWTFEPVDVARVAAAGRARGDLGFDDEAVETVVGLVDQVHTTCAASFGIIGPGDRRATARDARGARGGAAAVGAE